MDDEGFVNVQDFTATYLRRAGAVTEPAGYALLEVLVPDELAGQLESDQLLLAFDYEVAAETPGSVFVTHGSQLLDKVVGMASAGYGLSTVLYRPGSLPVLPRNFEQKLSRIEFRRCRPPKVSLSWVEEVPFYGYYFRAVYRSHEKSEELLEVVLNGNSGQAQAEFAQWWQRVVPAEAAEHDVTQAAEWPEDKLYAAACRAVEKQARTRAESVMAGAAGLKTRELAKITDYYDEIEFTLNKKLLAANDQDKKDRLEKQLAATRADRMRREKDVAERYGVEVDVRLDHVVVYRVPCLRIKLDVQHKGTVMNLTVLYNPLCGEVEVPVCPRCGQATWSLEPDREIRLVCAGGCRASQV
ncbi:MAG: hypothetical protein ACYCV0_15065 [Desulfitobacteriaceae bacterium]